MTVHVLHYEMEGRARWGVLANGKLREIEGEFPTTGDFLRHNPVSRLAHMTSGALDPAAVRWLSPITRNQSIVCQGANYRSHMRESGLDPEVKNFNMFFTKASSAIMPANGDVIRPAHVTLLDYEVELGLVLGRDVRSGLTVTRDNVGDLIAGITIINDYSARDVQLPQMQFYKGKSFRTFAPVGPYLCLLEPGEAGYLDDLELTLTVNGQTRQRANTSEQVYGAAETLTELSHLQDLSVGDLIATGTPAGCALRVPSPLVQRLGALLPERTRWQIFLAGQRKRSQYLKPGDLVETRIKSADGVVDLGVQKNLVVTA